MGCVLYYDLASCPFAIIPWQNGENALITIFCRTLCQPAHLRRPAFAGKSYNAAHLACFEASQLLSEHGHGWKLGGGAGSMKNIFDVEGEQLQSCWWRRRWGLRRKRSTSGVQVEDEGGDGP